MTAQVTGPIKESITIEVTVPLGGSMLQAEEAIQDGLNEVGLLATEEKLKWFDTDGSPIQVGSIRMTSKGQFSQDYETPYGIVAVLRHVYQTSEGGKNVLSARRECPNGPQRHAEIRQTGLLQICGGRSGCRCRRFAGMPSSKDFQTIRQVAWRYCRHVCRCQRGDLELCIAGVQSICHCASIAIGVDLEHACYCKGCSHKMMLRIKRRAAILVDVSPELFPTSGGESQSAYRQHGKSSLVLPARTRLA